MAINLGQQVGPLPLGAWVVVVGGGLGIAYYTKTHSPGPTIENNTSGQPGVGDGTVGGWVPTQPTTGPSVADTPPTNNEEWAYKAKAYLIGMGYPTTTVESAITKYVNGETPSVQEYTLVGLALAKIGPLPQTLPTAPVPPATTPQYPRGYGWHHAKAGDNIKTIADAKGITVATFILYNGPGAIKAGRWYKVRANSNPLFYYDGKP